MTTFTVIGEPLPGAEAAYHSAAARDLVRALSHTAPRGWDTQLLLAHDTPHPDATGTTAAPARLHQRAAALPYLWRTSSSARPRSGELHHTMTPLAPVRSRHDHTDPQISVFVPHALAWHAPELLSSAELRLLRTFTKRALKHADVVLTPTHAVAQTLISAFGYDIPVQVLPVAAPTAFQAPIDTTHAAQRKTELRLPDVYLLTTATSKPNDRLEWIYEALRANDALPPLVVLTSSALEIPDDLTARVHAVQPEQLSDYGVVLSHATLFVSPQHISGTGYELLGALSAGVPVIYSDCAVAEELVLDAGVTATTAEEFSTQLTQLFEYPETLERLRVLAEDRGRAFSWNNTAMQLWELHANL